MCVVSMVGDTFTDEFPKRWPGVVPYVVPTPIPAPDAPLDLGGFSGTVTRAEFDALRREVAELKELLKAAKRYDDAAAQPHCEKPEKLKLLFALAKAMGVDMSDLALNENGGKAT